MRYLVALFSTALILVCPANLVADDATELAKLRAENTQLKATISMLYRKIARLQVQLNGDDPPQSKTTDATEAKSVDEKLAPVPDHIARLLSSCEAERQILIARCEQTIKDNAAKVRASKPGGGDRTSLPSRQADLRKRIRQLKSGKTLPVPQMARIEVGAMGTLARPASYSQVTIVEQIADAQNMLASVVVQNIRRSNSMGRAVGPSREVKRLVWFKGLDTTRLTTGQRLQLDGVFHVTGTRQYETLVGGTNTVCVVEPVDLAPYIKKGVQIERR